MLLSMSFAVKQILVNSKVIVLCLFLECDGEYG